MTRFEELRSRYPVFRYETYEIERSPSRLTARFKFSAPPDISFAPEVHFEGLAEGTCEGIGDKGSDPRFLHTSEGEFLDNVIFHLGLIESFSYWKATASPTIEVLAGALSDDQIAWWRDLLIRGMGEYFYRNDIDFTAPDLVRIVSKDAGVTAQPYAAALPSRSLLTIGGGRDSALAAALLRDSGSPFACLMLNPPSAALKIAAMATNAKPLIIRRAICPELLELNRRGYLNGHTPFSAYLAFLGAACLLLYGYSNVIVANERSSEEGNVRFHESEINHQYSKSFRFETCFDEYLAKYLVARARYFSFVRPLYELQIGKAFAQFPEFFSVFKSCNRNRSDSWCGQCPKCVSVFLTMYPFVSHEALVGVFGRNLFEREETIPILRELAGVETKPFECVATTNEIVSALALAIAKVHANGGNLPCVLEYAAGHIAGSKDTRLASTILAAYGPHRIPSDFESFLRRGLK